MPSPSVLIMEDDLNILRLFSKALEKMEFQVFKSRSLAQTHKWLEQTSFTVFVCDMRVTDGIGLELLYEKWSLLKRNNTKVIVISAEEQYAMECKNLGVDVFLTKPVLPNALARIVSHLCGVIVS